MGNGVSRLQRKKLKTDTENERPPPKRVRRGLDGKNKGLKIRTRALTCWWKDDCPQVSILDETIRIEDENNNLIQMKGDQDKIEIGGFQMRTLGIVEDDGRKGYCLGINTKVLNLATFEVEVEKNGTVILRGRKLRESKEGQLTILTSPQVHSQHVSIDAAENNRTVWIRIYYETPPHYKPSYYSQVEDVNANANEIHLHYHHSKEMIYTTTSQQSMVQNTT